MAIDKLRHMPGKSSFVERGCQYTVKKECFETPLLVATQLQPILVFGNTILSRFKTQRMF